MNRIVAAIDITARLCIDSQHTTTIGERTVEYYTPEELDAMPVGTELPTPCKRGWTKLSTGFWRLGFDGNGRTSSLRLGGRIPKPLSAPVTPSQPTYPTPTLGELVALRESLVRQSEVAYREGYTPEASTLERFRHVEGLIDERIGL